MRFLTLFMLVTCSIIAQEHPNVRHMERAHPTPVVTGRQYRFPYLVPIVAERRFPSRFDNVDMITGENDDLPVQNESSIAINPVDPRNIIGSAVDYRKRSSTWAYYSINGGKTWENVDLGTARQGWTSSNDPSVAFDADGRGYLCYGGFNRTTSAQFGENGVFISVTNDGGRTWNPKHVPVIIHTGQQTADSSFEDKYYVHVDTASASPFRHRVYIPWKRVVNADSSTQIVIARSLDRGLTWLPPVPVSTRFPHTSEDTTFGQSFPLARTGPDGSVHLVWNSGTERAVRYARSTDGGATWTAPRIIQRYNRFGIQSTIGGQTNSRVKGIVRAEAYPTMVIDNTNGPRRGNIYLVWSADRIPNVYFSRSTDNGETWSAPVIVHSDTTNDQFWPWIALDPVNGDLGVMYFDSRDDAANILVNCYVSYSADGGLTWKDRRVGNGINDLRRNPFSGNTFAGDYSGMDFRDGMLYPSWVDMRHTDENPSNNDVYTAIVNVRAPAAVDEFTATTLPTDTTSISLAWTAPTERSYGQPLALQDYKYALYRNGRFLREIASGTTTYLDQGLDAFTEYTYGLEVVSTPDTSARRIASAFSGGSRQPAAPAIMVATGSEGGTMISTFRLPSRRSDGITPLVNMAKIRIRLDEQTFDLDVAASDTGVVRSFDALPSAWGWYHVSARIVDILGNVGPSSDTLIAYTGSLGTGHPMLTRGETFDTMPRLLRIRGAWDRTTLFSYSPDASLTESPNGPYGPSQRDSIMLYPFRVTPRSAALTFWHAAFIDPGDTAYVDIAYSYPSTQWTTLATYNAGQYDRWKDTTKGTDAWRFASIPFTAPREGDTAYVRLRMRTNVTRHSDGWYVDDIKVTPASGVEEGSSIATTVRPQPASLGVAVGLATEVPLDRVTVTSMDGVEMEAPWTQSSRTLHIDLHSVPSGVYSVTFMQGMRAERRVIHVWK